MLDVNPAKTMRVIYFGIAIKYYTHYFFIMAMLFKAGRFKDETIKTNAFWETEKIGKHMKKYAIPCVISLLVAALYNIVDQIFIANATYLGSLLRCDKEALEV